MGGHIHRQFQTAPYAKLVKRAAQVVLDDLLAGANDLADLTVGQTLPNQRRHLYLFRSKALARHHDCASSLVNMAMASFTRLRPSRIPARRNSVRRCCFTVRGLILSWPAISLLLQPCTSRFKTCWSRGVTLTWSRLITDFLLPFWRLDFSYSTAFANYSRSLADLLS